MIRLRAVFMVKDDDVADKVQDLLDRGAVAIEINYDPGEP